MNNIDAFTRRQGGGWTRCVLFPKKGTSCRDIHGLIVTMCCSHKLLNFAPYMKETSLFFLGYTDLSCLFAVWGRGWCIFFRCLAPFPSKVDKVWKAHFGRVYGHWEVFFPRCLAPFPSKVDKVWKAHFGRVYGHWEKWFVDPYQVFLFDSEWF